MTPETLPALALFAFVSSATPGPNNLMLMASGANYGLMRTLPHMLGISIGFFVLMLGAGFGMVRIFEAFPAFYAGLRIVSVGYLLYLAWRIAFAAPAQSDTATGSPMTFLQAAAFQWVNPKAWTMALTAITFYVADAEPLMLMLAGICFIIVNVPSMTLWTVLGQQMARLLTNPARLRAFNWTMAALLVASLYPILFSAQ